MKNSVTFDTATFTASINDFLKLKDANKASRDAMRMQEGKAELALIVPALEYAAQTFDLQPLATFVSRTKPSALTKRIIDACFPSHTYALLGDERRPAFVVKADLAKVADDIKLQVLRDAMASGDSINCEQIKVAFPAPNLEKIKVIEKFTSAIAKRMKADGLTKADVAAILKGM
jgi:hypothetical protein